MTLVLDKFTGFGIDTLNHPKVDGISRYSFIIKDALLDLEYKDGKPNDPTLLELFSIAAEEFAKDGMAIKLAYITREEKSNGKTLTPAELLNNATVRANLLVRTYMGITANGGSEQQRADAMQRVIDRIKDKPCFKQATP